jgi:adenylate cyclase
MLGIAASRDREVSMLEDSTSRDRAKTPESARGPTASCDVFISYASQDTAVANRIVDSLEQNGLKCWIAPRNVTPGSLYADEIVRAINDARVVVAILSEAAVASPHVGKEIERASSKRRRIVALHLEPVALPRAFEYFLSESQWINVGPDGVEAGTATLVEAVRRHLDSATTVEPRAPSVTPVTSRAGALSTPKWMMVGGVAAVALFLGYFVIDHFVLPKHPATTSVSASDRPGAGNEPPAPATASIAVLAFSDLSAEGNQGYFSDGIAEEILNVLSHVKGIKVASRTSSFQFRKSELGASAIAQKLGVRHVLEGSVRKAGTTVRVTAQLIDARTDQHVWSETFDRPLSTANIFAIQDDIAKNIVDHLAATMGSVADTASLATRKADTADAGAYDLYLRGRSLFIDRSKQNLISAVAPLKAAVAKDPKFARAWEMLGAVLVTSHYWDIAVDGESREGPDAIDTALRLDPSLSLAYAVRGEVQLDMVPRRGAVGWEESSDSYARAIENDPMNATAYLWRGSDYAALGYLDRATLDYQKCLEVDPAYELCRRHLAWAYLFLGRTNDALRSYELGIENGYVAGDTAAFAPAALARGDRLGALGMLALEFQDEPQLLQPLFRSLTDPTFGNRDRQDAVALVSRVKHTGYLVPTALWILKAYDERIGDDVDPPMWWARDDPAWLKSQVRKEAMQRWHLPDYWRKHGFPPQCAPIGNSDFECR